MSNGCIGEKSDHQKMSQESRFPHAQNILNPYLSPTKSINSKHIKGLNVTPETLKLVEENRSKNKRKKEGGVYETGKTERKSTLGEE